MSARPMFDQMLHHGTAAFLETLRRPAYLPVATCPSRFGIADHLLHEVVRQAIRTSDEGVARMVVELACCMALYAASACARSIDGVSRADVAAVRKTAVELITLAYPGLLEGAQVDPTCTFDLDLSATQVGGTGNPAPDSDQLSELASLFRAMKEHARV